MDRRQRRRASRLLRNAMARAEVEGGVTASCAYADCRALVAVGTSMEVASERLHQHYADDHDGVEP